ncbi:MAG: type II secretion system protein [Planctomycetota bacterium]
MRHRARRAFSLIELVIVIAILGIIAAVAVPRMSQGSEGASEAALKVNLATLRSAIEVYQAEHNGSFPSEADVTEQLTLFTDINGNTDATKGGAFVYGPYIRAIPPLPVGAAQGSNTVANAAGDGVGWIYDDADGSIVSNTTNTETASDGNTLYSDF